MRRYPEYKESGVEWIGKMPQDWELVRGKFILSHKKEINSDFQCDNLLSLTLNGVLRKDMNSAEGLRPSDYATYQVFYPENLVFKLIDLENIQTSRVGIVPEKGIMSPVYIRLESNSDLHERYYFYQYYDLYKKHIFNFLGKGVRSSLSPSNLLEIPLVFPTPSEQIQIANFLDRKTEQIDELIRIKERRIELLQEQRTALINQAVTKGLDPNVEMKPSGAEWIGEIPKNWCKVTVGNLGKVITGYTPPTQNIEYFGNKYPFITPTDIMTDSRTVQTERFLSQKGHEYNKSRLLPKNAVCVTCIASIGKICMTTVSSITNQQINSVVVNQDKYNPCFVYYLLKNTTDVIQSVANSATTPIVNKSTFVNINICVPPLNEQTQIANFLDQKTEQIDELIAAEHQKIELLKEYRQSLISEAVTGKIDVRNEV